MKCPVCEHETGKALLKCSQCSAYFDRELLEEYEHLSFLLAWLDEQETLDTAVRRQLADDVQQRQERLRGGLGILPVRTAVVETAEPAITEEPAGAPTEITPEIAAAAVPAAIPARVLAKKTGEIALLLAARKFIVAWPAGMSGVQMKILSPLNADLRRLESELGGRPVDIEERSQRVAVNYIDDRLEAWATKAQLTLGETDSIRDYLYEKRDAPEPPRVSPAAPPLFKAVPVREAEPVVPLTQVIREFAGRAWSGTKKKISDAAASGMLLNALLYLGAFMVVISAGILVVRFWDSFPPAAQLGVIAAVPATFYLLGWLGLTQLKLPNAGRVLTYVGALLVAVDFAAIYQFGGLAGQIDIHLFWLIASVVCTVIYALTAWRLPTAFTGTLALVGLTSILAAGTALLGLSLRWQVTAVALAALIMLAIALRLKRVDLRWQVLGKSAQGLALFLLPAAQILVLIIPGDTVWAQMVTFILATVGYAILAWRFAPQVPRRALWQAIFSHASVWSSLGALALLVLATGLHENWYAIEASVVAGVYIVAGKLFSEQLRDELPGRRWILAPFYEAGFGLLFVALVLGVNAAAFEPLGTTMRFWTGTVALALIALVLMGCAAMFRNAWFLLAGSGFIVLPFSLAISRRLLDMETPQWLAWLMLSWTAVALLYTILARLLPLAARYGLVLNLWAQAVVLAALAGLWVGYSAQPAAWFAGPTLIVMAAAFAVYLLAALIHDGAGYPALSRLVNWLPEPLRSSVFIWPLAMLIPAWMATAWLGGSLPREWLGPVLAIVGLGYVGLGQIYHRYRATYRVPLHTLAYILPLLGIGLALYHSRPLLISTLLAVAGLAGLAAIYRRTLETVAAALLFIWPFHLALMLSPISVFAYPLAYALLACLVYIPLGQLFHPSGCRIPWRVDRTEAPLIIEMPRALAFYLIGYFLAVAAVIVVLRDRLVFPAASIPWIGAAVPAIVCGLMVFSFYRFREKPFAWTAVLLLAISYGQALTWLKLPMVYHATAWVSLALLFMLTERGLARRAAGSWLAGFRWPLGLGAMALCALGLALTAPATWRVFSGQLIEEFGPVILAQSLAALLVILAAPLYHSRWPLYLEPALIFFPVTLFFGGYGENLFGRPLTSEAFGLVWLGLAVVNLVTAALLDGRTVRYAHGLYLGGYGLALLALIQSTSDPVINIMVLGVTILIALGSQILIHFGRHHTFDDFIHRLWRRPGSVAWRAARIAFLFYAAYAFPIWLARLLLFNDVSMAWLGTAFALAAPLTIALGLLLRRVKREYTWPLFSAGYTLTAVGAMIATNDQRLFIAVLSLNMVVYAISATIFKQPFWLYLSNTLLPVIALLLLATNELLVAPWTAGIFMGLAYLYIAAGWLLNRRLAHDGHLSSFALPFYTLGYLLSAAALAVGSSERLLAIGVFSAGVLLYAVSARLLRESVFLYPAAWLAAVPYILIMTLTNLPRAWYGVGLLPLILLYIGIGRFLFKGHDLGITDRRAALAALAHPALPFYILAYVFSVGMVVISWGAALPLTVVLAAAAAVYFISAALFASFLWIYPGLLATHVAILAALSIAPSGSPTHFVSLPFVVVTWLLVLVGLVFARFLPVNRFVNLGQQRFNLWQRELSVGGWPFTGHLLTPSWSQPFFIFAALDVIVWQMVALGGFNTALFLAVSNLLLLGFLATLWQDGALAYGSLGFTAFAAATGLRWAGWAPNQILALMGGVGLLFYAVSLLVDLGRRRLPAGAIWVRPLHRTAIGLSVVAMVGSLPSVVEQPLATAGALGFAGALYLAMAYRGRNHELGYFAVGLMEIAWIVLLIGRAIDQPQLYAIPAGLYLAGIGAMERRRERYRIANILEGCGLTIILLTSLIQSLNPQSGFPTFVLLIVESLLALIWGAWRRAKVPFFMGLGASFINVVAQLAMVATVNDIWRWVIILGAGMLVIGLAILYERKRERLALQIQEWQVELESWS